MKAVERQRLGADAWRGLVSRFADSGVSVRVFCAREGISDSSFNRWRKRLNDGASRPPAVRKRAIVPSSVSGFVDLGALSSAAGARQPERIELRLDLGGGMMLHLVRG